MNTFAWNILLEWNKVVQWIDFDYIESLSKSWDKLIFLYWETDIKSSKELKESLENILGDFLQYDISISSEEKVQLLWEGYEEWIYELATFEWEQVDFNEILDRFRDFEEVVCIREAEASSRYWNKCIKVDFVY